MADQDIGVTVHTLQRAAPMVTGLSRPGLELKVQAAIGIAKVQIWGGRAESRLAGMIGIAPPTAGRQVEKGGVTVSWLAPGEWLLTGEEMLIAGQLAQINEDNPSDVLALDISHARTALLLSGDGARAALSAHCPLDLWHGVFPVGAVARSLLGEAVMFLARLPDGPDGPCFQIIVDQTVGAYAARLIASPNFR